MNDKLKMLCSGRAETDHTVPLFNFLFVLEL